MTGSEELASIFKCLTSIELFENAQFYSSHPVIKLQHDKGAFTSPRNAFAMCLSNSALSMFEKHGEVAAIAEEARCNSNNHSFSSMMCMFALATVTGCTIQSYFPISNEAAPMEQWDSLAKMYNCSINPRSGNVGENVHIFRCAALLPQYIIDRKVPALKNHYVALCLPVTSVMEPGEQYFVPRLPRLCKSCTSSVLASSP